LRGDGLIGAQIALQEAEQIGSTEILSQRSIELHEVLDAAAPAQAVDPAHTFEIEEKEARFQ
jgi:hypothetical protein